MLGQLFAFDCWMLPDSSTTQMRSYESAQDRERGKDARVELVARHGNACWGDVVRDSVFRLERGDLALERVEDRGGDEPARGPAQLRRAESVLTPTHVGLPVQRLSHSYKEVTALLLLVATLAVKVMVVHPLSTAKSQYTGTVGVPNTLVYDFASTRRVAPG